MIIIRIMAWKRRRTTRRRVARRFGRRSRAPRARRVSRASVKQVVKKVLARNIETKTVTLEPNTRQLAYPAAGATFNSTNVVPLGLTAAGLQVLQGVGDGQRVGNKIKIKRLTFNFVLRPRGYDVSNNARPAPNNVRIILFYDRTAPVVNPDIRSDFFDYNNTDTGPSGDLFDMLAPINTNKYRKLAERTVKLGFSEAYGSGSDIVFQQFTNNDFKLNVMMKWDVTKYIPELVRYNDNSSTPSTRSLWAVFLPAAAHGDPGGSTTRPINLDYWLKAEYTDA